MNGLETPVAVPAGILTPPYSNLYVAWTGSDWGYRLHHGEQGLVCFDNLLTHSSGFVFDDAQGFVHNITVRMMPYDEAIAVAKSERMAYLLIWNVDGEFDDIVLIVI